MRAYIQLIVFMNTLGDALWGINTFIYLSLTLEEVEFLKNSPLDET